MEAPVATSCFGAVDQLAPVRVSYVLSTRNRKSELEKTLQNIRQFLSPKDELIIADGGSTDGTLDIFQSNTDIVTKVTSAPDLGEAHGFNRAILESRGRLIKPLTDDDYFYPEPMQQCITYMETHKNVDVLIAGGRCLSIDRTGAETFLWNHGLRPGISYRERIGSFDGIGVSGLGMFIRRDAIAVAGLFNTHKQFVDIDYFARLLKTNLNIRYIDYRLFDHRVWSASGCFDLQNNARFKREQIQAYFELGDWRSSASIDFREAVEAFRLGESGIAAQNAFRLLLFIVRHPSSLSSGLVASGVIPLGCAIDMLLRIRRVFLRLKSRFLPARSTVSDGATGNDFLKPDRRWTGAVW